MFFAALTMLSAASVCCTATSVPAQDPAWDLASYITRPELRAPLLNITRFEADATTPGYLFLAPYSSLRGAPHAKEYMPFQAGPYIYDNNGELVWSGAQLFENRNAYDFRVSTVTGSTALTLLLDEGKGASEAPEGGGVILDTSYHVRSKVKVFVPGEALDIHEFNVINNGKSSLTVFNKGRVTNITELEVPGKTEAFIDNKGFREIDVATGLITVEWWPLDHMSLAETMLQPPQSLSTEKAWDCLHTNSVDKDQEGNYLVSMRYTSAIYKISGVDGSIIWRLGGKLSNFSQNFNFSSQHDARFLVVNSTTTVISFLDNASDELGRQPPTSNTSAIKVVALDNSTIPMTAKIVRQFDRPDGGVTSLRGNAQILSNSGAFGGWSEHCYMSEFAPDGRAVFEARYVGSRFFCYRIYKFEFVGHPSEPPALKAFAYGSDESFVSMSSVCYVSWNGATEVASWAFYGRNDPSAPFQALGNITKSGFETMFVSKQFWAHTYAEARAANGSTLGSSPVQEIILPNGRVENITLVGLAVHQMQLDTAKGSDIETVVPASMLVLVVWAIALVGVAFIALLLMFLVLWKMRDSWHRSSYFSLQSSDNQAEEGELRLLKHKGQNDDEDHGKGDDERDDVIGNDRHFTDGEATTGVQSGSRHTRHRSAASILSHHEGNDD